MIIVDKKVKNITIPQGSVVKITEPNGVVLWQKENEPITTATPMYFKNADLIPVTISLTRYNDSAPLVTMEISTDGNNWELWGDSASGVERVIPVGGKLYIRATTNVGYFNKSPYSWNYFASTGKVNVGGNIMSIGYKEFENHTIITQDYAYQNMFYYMDKLVDASNLILPADVVSPYCYSNMFFACRVLKSSPKTLPATILDSNCYYCMFQRCVALTEAPELPATILAEHCYDHMFYYCRNINKVVIYADDIEANNALDNWLSYVSETGDFYNFGSAEYGRFRIEGCWGIPSDWTEHTSL